MLSAPKTSLALLACGSLSTATATAIAINVSPALSFVADLESNYLPQWQAGAGDESMLLDLSRKVNFEVCCQCCQTERERTRQILYERFPPLSPLCKSFRFSPSEHSLSLTLILCNDAPIQRNRKRFASMAPTASQAVKPPVVARLLSNDADAAAGVGPLQRDGRQAALVREDGLRSAKRRDPPGHTGDDVAQSHRQSAATNDMKDDELAATSPRPQPGQNQSQQPQPNSASDCGEEPPSPPSPREGGLQLPQHRRYSGSALQPATLPEAPQGDVPDATQAQILAAAMSRQSPSPSSFQHESQARACGGAATDT